MSNMTAKKKTRLTWTQALAIATAEQHEKRIARLEKKAKAGLIIVKTNADRDLLLLTGRWVLKTQVIRSGAWANQSWLLAQIPA